MGKTTHGMTRNKDGKCNPIFRIFDGIKQRCNNINHRSYYRYGGRGIKNEWNSFEEFYEDLGKYYKKGLSVDRIDNDGNYCKNNCRWATMKEQSRNTKNNKIILFRGENRCMAELFESFNIGYEAGRQRLLNGWSIERTLTTPIGESFKYGINATSESKRLGVSKSTIYRMIKDKIL